MTEAQKLYHLKLAMKALEKEKPFKALRRLTLENDHLKIYEQEFLEDLNYPDWVPPFGGWNDGR